jgi:integrase
MPIRWDTRNRRWRFEFDRVLQGQRHRLSRLLPRGWSQAQADTYDRQEGARLDAIAAGIEQRQPLIDEAVAHYLRDKRHLKSYKATAEHLGAIMWAYTGKTMAELPAVAQEVRDKADVAPGTVRNRLAVLKAAARWAWKAHGLVKDDPTARMQLPKVRNERHVYATRGDMLAICRACGNWQAQIAIRVAFYSGLRLGELYRVEPGNGVLLLADTKNGDRRAVPVHPKIAHLVDRLPLTAPKITVQRAWQVARKAAGLDHLHFHDLRHSAASEMVNAGVDLYTVGQVLGHRDSRSTARYSHLTAGTLAAAVGQIGKKKRA